MQLDIFKHSRATVLRNHVVNALSRREATEARSALQMVNHEFPHEATLPELEVLVDALEQRTPAAITDYDVAERARLVLLKETGPAAVGIFGKKDSRAWLAPLWQELAQRVAPLDFNPDRADDHAASMWLQSGEWAAAIDAAARIESWRHIPEALAWMSEASYRLNGLNATWALLAELAWLSPARFDQLAERLCDRSLEKLRDKFDASFEGGGNVTDLAWFPAWLLVEKPILARQLSETQHGMDSAPEQAMRLLIELLRLERDGRHQQIVECRKTLRNVHPSLYAAYLKTR